MKLFKSLRKIIAITLLLGCISGCNKTPTISVESIDILFNKESISSIVVNNGETFSLDINALPTGSSKSVRWWSVPSSTNVVTFDQKGNFFAKNEGSVIIGASSNENERIIDTISLIVSKPFYLEPSETDIEVGETFQINASVTYDVNWSSDDNSVASVDQNGLVTANGKGNTTIRATNLGRTATCKVNVYEKGEKQGEVKLDWNVTSLSVGETKQIPFSCDMSTTWVSNDTSIVSVDTSGKISAKKIGNAEITVSSSKDTKTIAVAVVGSSSQKINDYNLNDWYILGYGSFQQGGNYTINDDYKFGIVNYSLADFSTTYLLNNKHFNIGDSFQITNEEYTYRIKDTILSNCSSFKKEQAYSDESLSSVTNIDIVKSGYYDIYLHFNDNNNPVVNVVNISEDPVEPTPTSGTIDIYSFSDFHGNVEDVDTLQPGIGKYVSYFKKQVANKSRDDYLLINGGDLWEGSYYSNFNYGALLNETMGEMDVDAFSLGNHEFDWNQNHIGENQKATSFPYLGANIVYRNSQELVKYVQPYTITYKNGYKVGIIGTIGDGQITSIVSSYVDDIEFQNDVSVIKYYSDKLRTVFGCDVIVVSDHEGTNTSMLSKNSLGGTSSVSKERYIDAIIFGHDHTPDKGVSSDIGYINSASNGRYLSHMTLSINSSGVTTTVSENIGYRNISKESEDTNITSIINKYVTTEHRQKANSIAGVTDSELERYGTAANMMAKAIYEKVINEGFEISLSLVNNGRQNLPKGEITYSDVSNTFPFFNRIIIFKANGSEMIKEARYNYYYSEHPFEASKTETYWIATYDYLAFHKGTNREYNYFPKSDLKNYYEIDMFPFDIVFDFLKGKTGTIYASEFTGFNYSFIS